MKFIASKKFEGAKEGYVYKLGDAGLGYYLEKKKVKFSDEKTVDVAKTLQRLCAQVKTGKLKAITMLATFVEEVPVDSTVIGEALESLETDGQRSGAPDLAKIVRKLPELRPTYFLTLWCAQQLRSDDTYAFTSAMQHVMDALQALPSSKKRCDAILHCLAASWPNYQNNDWAKAPVDAALQLANEKITAFSPLQQAKLRVLLDAAAQVRGAAHLEENKRRAPPSSSNGLHPLRNIRQRRF